MWDTDISGQLGEPPVGNGYVRVNVGGPRVSTWECWVGGWEVGVKCCKICLVSVLCIGVVVVVVCMANGEEKTEKVKKDDFVEISCP